jgi:cysteinyl-tRNA synthetase
MALRIFNTLTRSKQDFIPLSAKQIKIYVCGVTVYDYCHLGHGRAYVVWDMVRRYLQFRYQSSHQVTFIQNITDIDDKILKLAKEQGVSMQEVSETFITAYNEDMAKLNVMPADVYPRATEFIPEMIAMIEELERKGYAYASQGDVYYAVERFPHYGKLSGRKLSDMQMGASGRVDETDAKRYPFDFALWKGAKPDEPFWESPWGRGRPGWHIECSAMVRACLGDSIDIHGGGADLQFPHHENEIAQSEATTGQRLAQYWMHNGFVNIDGEKMSKSLQNFKTIRSLLAVYDPMVIRLFILQSHYRQPIDFTEEGISGVTRAWQNLLEGLSLQRLFPDWQLQSIERFLDQQVIDRFITAMDDDFNTAGAIALCFELGKVLTAERNNLQHCGKTELSPTTLHSFWATLTYLLQILGFVINKDILPEPKSSGLAVDVIEKMINDRLLARQAKNYKESDRLRDELKSMGVTLVDQRDGTTRWFVE